MAYTFLDMTGDGIEELFINCNGSRLYVIQSECGILKAIRYAMGDNFETYLVKCNEKTGICCYSDVYEDSHEEYFYFFENKMMFLGNYQNRQENGNDGKHYEMNSNDGFGRHDISMGEYYNVSGAIIAATVDWYTLEEPNK